MPLGIGPGELVIVLLIALLVLGPKKLPEVGRSLGKGLREFKEGINEDDVADAATVEEDVRDLPPAAPAPEAAAPPAPAPVVEEAGSPLPEAEPAAASPDAK
jgi:sec-independent protein translocase protein TatA